LDLVEIRINPELVRANQVRGLAGAGQKLRSLIGPLVEMRFAMPPRDVLAQT